MFSPLADTTFSSFFSGVVSGAGLVGPQLGPTNILSHSPPPPPTNLHSSVKPGSFIDFGSSSGPGSGSLSNTFSTPQRKPSPPAASRPPPPPPQLTPDSFPGPTLGPGQSSDFDNFIPDFDPQEELEAFMNSIGDDFKDFNFERDSPRPVRQVRQCNVVFA